MMVLCARDPLWWMSTFVWTFNPRSEARRRYGSTVLPFIPWRFQMHAVSEVCRAVESGYDLVIEKSRDMGGTWMVLLVFLWRMLFKGMEKFLLVSRKDELVDGADDMDALMPKLDFTLKYLPGWMVPDISRQERSLVNDETGAGITGEASVEDAGRGGRATAMLSDEHASNPQARGLRAATADVADCRIFVFTPKGAANDAYDLAHDPNQRVMTLHWALHPGKNVGLYQGDDGKLRSPWYDRECRRRGRAQEVAQELDIDYLASDYEFFDPDVITRLVGEQAREPVTRGEMEFADDPRSARFRAADQGRLLMWMPAGPDGQCRPPAGRQYVVGVDVAAGKRDAYGTGYSNSVCIVADAVSRVQVAEYAVGGVNPVRFAAMSVALARWFNGAFMVWEANGPGGIFGDEVFNTLRYGNVYYRRNLKRAMQPMTDMPGWWSTVDSKNGALERLRSMLNEGQFVPRSRMMLDECRSYVYVVARQAVEHNRAAVSDDPTGARANHGDRVIAAAMCCLGLNEMAPSIPAPEENYPAGSFGDRFEKRHRPASRYVY